MRDNSDLMALINVVQQKLYRPISQARLSLFKILRAKMMIGYMSWQRHLQPAQLLKRAVLVTFVEKVIL